MKAETRNIGSTSDWRTKLRHHRDVTSTEINPIIWPANGLIRGITGYSSQACLQPEAVGFLRRVIKLSKVIIGKLVSQMVLLGIETGTTSSAYVVNRSASYTFYKCIPFQV